MNGKVNTVKFTDLLNKLIKTKTINIWIQEMQADNKC